MILLYQPLILLVLSLQLGVSRLLCVQLVVYLRMLQFDMLDIF